MSIEDRIALAEAIWQSIEADVALPRLTEAQRAELERRIAEHEAHPDGVIPWEQIKVEALTRCGF